VQVIDVPEKGHAASGPRGVTRGDVYFRYEVDLRDDRQELLDDWRAMGRASKAQDRIRDNAFLREHED